MKGCDRFLEPYKQHLDYAWKWVENNAVYLVRYEDLIGPKGGGHRKIQIQTIDNICGYLGIAKTKEEIESIADHLWGGKTRTMHLGQSKYWEKLYNKELRDLFESMYAKYQTDLGYDLDW